MINGEFETQKEVGSIANLKAKIKKSDEIVIGIAHTRWATHGKVTKTNSHPHFSTDNEWGIVHNGIIENYKEILSTLKNKPNSDTDTAVLAELLSEKDICEISDFIKVFDDVHGSFAIVGINKSKKDTLFLAKRKSPLFVCKNI